MPRRKSDPAAADTPSAVVEPEAVLDAAVAPPEPKKRRRRRQTNLDVDPEAQQQLHTTLLMSIGTLTLLLEARYKPTAEEVDSIIVPAERIILRRFSLPNGLNPDLVDGTLIIVGVAGYAIRISRESARYPRSHAPQPTARPNPGPGRSQPVTQSPLAGASNGAGPDINLPDLEGQLAALWATGADTSPGGDARPREGTDAGDSGDRAGRE